MKETSHLKTIIRIVGGSVIFTAAVGGLAFGVNLIPSVCDSNPTCPFKPAQATTKIETAPMSKWKNPNIKPFAESPYLDYGKVIWDEGEQQWRCEVEKGGTTPCSNAEGKTAEQLKEDGAQARVNSARFHAEREARERALNEYWCGPFEDPKKTGCNEL